MIHKDVISMRARGPSAQSTLAPRCDWRDMHSCEHFVQFYDSDAFLIDCVAGFLQAGLNAGDGVVAIAGKPHRDAIEAKLAARGLDLAELASDERYLALDAADTLSRFMVDGIPDQARFDQVISDVVRRAGNGNRHVRAFGEMVALLWAAGNGASAVRLEELWNGFATKHAFSLFCAYPMSGFHDAGHANGLVDICTRHSRVIPAESYVSIDDTDARLRAIALLQQKAASLEGEIARRRASERDRERLLQSERAARAEAERLGRIKDEFLATLSHELRTPLNAVLGWTQLLQRKVDDAAQVKSGLEIIERSARVQARIISDLLDMSSIISGKVRLDVQPVELPVILDAAIESVRPAADAKSIQIGKKLDMRACHADGDPARLQQVVWNLLTNAVKFTPAGGRIDVHLRRVNSHYEIVVADSGQGISPDFLPHVFDRFRQADSSTTRRFGGLGLGLSIVKQIVELHGGTVTAASRGDGHGAAFTVTLPMSKRDNALDSHAASANGNGVEVSLTGLDILVVDDDSEAQGLLARVLREYAASVRVVGSAAEALDELRKRPPSLLISDISMPGQDGYELMRHVRALPDERQRSVPALALTAFAHSDDRIRALRSGYQMHMAKPIEAPELLASVASLARISVSST